MVRRGLGFTPCRHLRPSSGREHSRSSITYSVRWWWLLEYNYLVGNYHRDMMPYSFSISGMGSFLYPIAQTLDIPSPRPLFTSWTTRWVDWSMSSEWVYIFCIYQVNVKVCLFYFYNFIIIILFFPLFCPTPNGIVSFSVKYGRTAVAPCSGKKGTTLSVHCTAAIWRLAKSVKAEELQKMQRRTGLPVVLSAVTATDMVSVWVTVFYTIILDLPNKVIGNNW